MTVYHLINALQLPIERLNVSFLPPARLVGPDSKAARVEIWISGTGTGKTERLIPLIQDARDRGERVVVIVHRQALADGTAARFALPCYREGRGEIFGNCTICLDSIKRISGRVDCIIFDEADQGASHALGRTIKEKNLVHAVHLKMKALCKRAKKIIVQSATFQPESLEHVLAWTGREGVTVFANEGNPVAKKVQIYRTVSRETGAEAQLLADLRKEILKGGKCALACSSAKDAQAFGRKISSEIGAEFSARFGREIRVKILYRDSKDEGDNAECLRRPALFKDRCDVLVYSPVIGSGVDISDRDTWNTFAVVKGWHGGPPVTEALQLIDRVRYPIGDVIRLVVSGRTEADDRTVEEIFEDLRAPARKTSERFTGIAIHDSDDPLDLEIFKLAARQQIMLNRLGGEWADKYVNGERVLGAFTKLLRQYPEKYIVGEIVPREVDPLDLSVAKDEIKAEKVERILNAEKISTEEAAEKDRSPTRTQESAAEVAAAKIRDLVGCDQLDRELVDFCEDGGRKRIAQFRDCVLRKRGHEKRLLGRDRVRRDPDKFNDCVRAEAILAVLVKFGIDLECNPDDLKPLTPQDFSAEEKTRLRQHLGMRLKDDTKTIRILRSVLEYIGLSLKVAGKKNGVRAYQVDPDSLRRMQTYTAAAIERKIEQSGQEPDVPSVGFRVNRVDLEPVLATLVHSPSLKSASGPGQLSLPLL